MTDEQPDVIEDDFDGDGTVDTAYGYDDDKDGVYDQVDVDLQSDGDNDVSAFDENGDHTYDHIQADTDGDGVQDYAVSDTNYDGTLDTEGSI